MPCSRTSLDVAIKGQTNLTPISGRVPELILEFAHGRSGFQGVSLRWNFFPKAALPWQWWIFAVDFVGHKMQKKNPPKKSARKSANEKSAGARPPPKSTSQAQKSAAKPTNKSACQTSKYRPGFFLIAKACSWRRLQSMDSGTLFGCFLGMVEAPMLKCTCNPSAAAGGRDKVCCAPFQNTFGQKRSF